MRVLEIIGQVEIQGVGEVVGVAGVEADFEVVGFKDLFIFWFVWNNGALKKVDYFRFLDREELVFAYAGNFFDFGDHLKIVSVEKPKAAHYSVSLVFKIWSSFIAEVLQEFPQLFFGWDFFTSQGLTVNCE